MSKYLMKKGLIGALTALFSGMLFTVSGIYDWSLAAAASNHEGWPKPGKDIRWTYHYRHNAEQAVDINDYSELFDVSWFNSSVLTGDVTGDGKLDMVYSYSDILYILDSNGEEVLNIPIPASGHLNMLADVTGDRAEEMIVSSKSGTTLKLSFYDSSGTLLKEITESNGVSDDNGMTAHAVVDMDNDGDLEVVCSRGSGYDLWSRGVEVFDYSTGAAVWFDSIGPTVRTPVVADITGDGKKEILIGTGGPSNGHNTGGFSDSRCYAICYDYAGNILWSRQFEGSGFVDSEVAAADLDGNGANEVIYTSRAHGWGAWDGNLGRIYLLDPATGSIVDENNMGKPLHVMGVADFTGDGNKEILTTYKDGSTQTGKILMFDLQLNLIKEYAVNGSRVNVRSISDLTGSGKPEVIVSKNDASGIMVLDSDLTEIWSALYDDLGVIPSDIDHDGINEILVSTADRLIVLDVSTLIIRLTGDLSFGDVTVGESSHQTLTVHNDSNSTLNVNGINYPSGFSGNWSGAISAGGSQNVTVTFSPMAAQNYSGNITVDSDANGGKKTIGCSGTGVPAEVFTVSGNVTGSIAGHDDLAIRNATVNLSGTSLSTATDNNGDFVLSDVPDGIYSLHISAPGLEPVTIQITVNGDDLPITNIPTMTVRIGTGCDVNGDGKIGLAEAINALRNVTGF